MNLEPRVLKLETRADEHDRQIADLQSAQREDAEMRGVLVSTNAAVNALANGHKAMASDLAVMKHGPMVANAGGMSMLANLLAQAITGKDAASAEAITPAIVVLLGFLLPLLGRFLPKKEGEKKEGAEPAKSPAPSSDANGAADDTHH